VRVLHEALTEQFGFKHLLWVYSGRRGIHLWIADKEAMELDDESRKAIVGWLEVIKGGKEMKKKVNVRLGAGKNGPGSLPPSLQTALTPLATLFSSLILTDQNCFGSEKGYEALLQLIPDGGVAANLRKKWEDDPDRHSVDKWGDLKSEVKRFEKGSSMRVRPSEVIHSNLSLRHLRSQVVLQAALEDIILQYTYPRIDAEVSKHRNHLLKAPFCVHPKTGRVCVPVDPEKVDEFDPEGVPNVGGLLRELDEAGKMEVDEEGGEHHNGKLRVSADL
jgi:DNA primase small subunit